MASKNKSGELIMYTTTDMLQELYRIYNALNARFFEGNLPPVFITLVPGKSRKKATYGCFTPNAWAKAKIEEKVTDEAVEKIVVPENPQHEIAISSEYFTRGTASWVATMVHEMVHLHCCVNEINDTSNNGVYHNKRFKYEAEKTKAINIDYAQIIGYSVTTPSSELTYFIDNELNVNEEIFAWFRNTQLGLTAKAPKKRYICPFCQLEVQTKKNKKIICGECYEESNGEQIVLMDYWDITDPDSPELLEDNNPGLDREGEKE